MLKRNVTAHRVEVDIVGHSPAFLNVLKQVRIIAKSDSVTLIQAKPARAKKSSLVPFTIKAYGAADRSPKLNYAAIPGTCS